MVGILEREDAGCGLLFPAADLDVIQIGSTRDDLGGSEWQQMFAPEQLAQPPHVDLDYARDLIELLLELHESRLLRSAHDVSNGGIAVALAECAMGGVGCYARVNGHDLDAVSLLFSETQGRVVASCNKEHTAEILRRAQARKIRAAAIGVTAERVFVIEHESVPLIRTTTPELARVWRSAFALLLGGDTVDDVIRGVGEEAPEVLAH
jgi:phosphoribosylformylglycinamidine synthase